MSITNPLPPAIPTFFSVLQPPTSIDYTSKDWTGFTTSMLNYAAVIMPEWDTSSEGDFGVMLVELFAYMGDILSFYGDRLTQEAYLPTATQRLSILNLAQLLGYIPVTGTAATGTVTLQSTGPAVVVPAGTQISTGFVTSTDQPIIYQTNAQVTVPANGGTVNVAVTQGITNTAVVLGVSTGLAGQVFQIPQAGVENGTVVVTVSSTSGSTQWNPITFLVDADADDLVYSISVDQNNMTNITFGDNINGAIPAVGLTISATYTIGLGSQGNQPAGSVGVIVSPIQGIFVPFTSSTATTYQSTAMTGGSDPETNDQIRANAPLAYSTQSRAVSLVDFQNLALNIPGVLMANAVGNHSTSVTLYVLGPNYQAPSVTLQNVILATLNGMTLAGVTLTIGTPTVVLVDAGSMGTPITVQVKPNYNQGVVAANVTTALQSALSPPNTSFGMLMNVSVLYSAIMSVPGVFYANVPVFTREDVAQTGINPIQFRQSEIPSVGNIFITASGGLVS